MSEVAGMAAIVIEFGFDRKNIGFDRNIIITVLFFALVGRFNGDKEIAINQ